MRKHVVFLSLFLASIVCFTSCSDDNDGFVPGSTQQTDTLGVVTVQYNPSSLAVASNRLFIQGYGGAYPNYTYPVELFNDADSTCTEIGHATKMTSCGDMVYMVYGDTDWSTNTTTNTFTSFNAATGEKGGDFLVYAPASLYSTGIYMMTSNGNTGDIFIGTTDYKSSSTVYRFNSEGRLQQTINIPNASVNSALFVGAEMYFLVEGVYSFNNSDLYVYQSGSDDVTALYSTANGGAKLGDTAQSMLYANGSIYVVVYGSSYIARLDVDGRETARYACTEADGQPRYAAYAGNSLYVSTYGGKVIKLDASLNKVDEIAVGNNPESIIVHKGHLYVVCSGWGQDNRMFIINPDLF